MTALRRHLLAATWVILSTQTLAMGLGTAQACWAGEHTHGGVPAPDCSMHHQAGPGAQSMQHHSHDAHATPSEPASDSGQRMTCRCSNDAIPMYLGQTAILQVPAPWSPGVQAVMVDAASDPFAVDHLFSPPSPPPR